MLDVIALIGSLFATILDPGSQPPPTQPATQEEHESKDQKTTSKERNFD